MVPSEKMALRKDGPRKDVEKMALRKYQVVFMWRRWPSEKMAFEKTAFEEIKEGIWFEDTWADTFWLRCMGFQKDGLVYGPLLIF